MLSRHTDQSSRIHDDQNLFNSMKSLLASLNDEELEAIADDLDFCRFTGVQSDRLTAVLRRIAAADPELQALLNDAA